MSAADRASEAYSTGQANESVDQVNEWAMQLNEQADEQMTQYSMRQFHILFTQCATSVFLRVVVADTTVSVIANDGVVELGVIVIVSTFE